MPCSQSNEREQTPLKLSWPLFLETTIQIERVVGLPERKEAIKNRILTLLYSMVQTVGWRWELMEKQVGSSRGDRGAKRIDFQPARIKHQFYAEGEDVVDALRG